jgi:glycosyltransferase involved in cell wall biosynthesis
VNKIIVITPTTGAPELEECILSVMNQSIDVEHLLVVDGPEKKAAVDKIVSRLGAEDSVIVCTLPFNTGGGGFYGHRVFAGFSHLLDHDYIFLLDEDNRYELDHVETMLSTIITNNYEWAYSLRKIIDYSGSYLFNDDSVSLGSWSIWGWDGVWLVDTSTYAFTNEFFKKNGHMWHSGWGGDRKFFNQVQHSSRYGTSGKYTLDYRLSSDPTKAAQDIEFVSNGNKEIDTKYSGVYPWRSTDV